MFYLNTLVIQTFSTLVEEKAHAIISAVTDSHPHWLRSAMIAGIGLIIATVSIIWVGLTIRAVGPETLSLAYRIDPKQTLAFVRTNDSASLKASIETMNVVFNEKNGAIDFLKLPEGTSYEYALMQRAAEEQREWALSVHQRNQEETMVTSTSGASLFLPIRQIKMSLGASSFFRTHEKESVLGVFYVRLETVPALVSSESGLLGGILKPFSSLLILKKADSHRWILEKKEGSLFTSNTPLIALPSKDSSPLLAVSIGNPQLLFENLDRIMTERNPSLWEGVNGVIRQKLEHISNRELFRHGAQIAMIEEGNDTRFVVQGNGTSTEEVKKWIQRVLSSETPAVIRARTLLHGNARTDITASMETMTQTENGWQSTIGSGAALPFSIATKGRTVLFGNDAELLRDAMVRTGSPMPPKRGILQAILDTGWLLRHPGTTLLSPEEVALLRSIARKVGKQMTVEADDSRETVTLEIKTTL